MTSCLGVVVDDDDDDDDDIVCRAFFEEPFVDSDTDVVVDARFSFSGCSAFSNMAAGEREADVGGALREEVAAAAALVLEDDGALEVVVEAADETSGVTEGVVASVATAVAS